MTVIRMIGYECGDTSEMLGIGPGCSVVAAPGSGNAGAWAYRNAATDATELSFTNGINLARVRCSFRFYVAANPSADVFYTIVLRTSTAALVGYLFVMFEYGFGWWISWNDSTGAAGPSNYITHLPDASALGWVTFEIDCEIGATSTTTTAWYTRDADGIRHAIGMTGNGTDTAPPSTMNFGTANIENIRVKWDSGASEPFYVDDFVVDDAAMPGQARIISRPFVSTTPPSNSWDKSTGSTIDTVWNDTPYNPATYAREYIWREEQSAIVSSFSATASGKGSGVIDDNDIILGWKWASIGRAVLSDGNTISEVGTSTSSSATNGANVTLTFSVAPIAGDTVIVWGGFNTLGANSPGISTAGYTQVILNTATASRKFGVWRKVMGYTPDTNVVCLGSGSAGDGVAYGSIVLRQTDNSATLDITAATPATGSSTNPDPPASGASLTTNPLVLAFGASSVHDASKGTQTNFTQLATPTANATRAFSTTASKRQYTSGVAGVNDDPPAWSSWATGNWIAATILIRGAGYGADAYQPFVRLSGGGAETAGFGYYSTSADMFFGYVISPTPSTVVANLNGSEWGLYKGFNSPTITVYDLWPMVAYRAVSGTSYSDTVAETAAAADAQSSLWIGSRAVAESAAATDAPASTGIKPVTLAETAAIADAPASTAIKPVATAETMAAADAPAGALVRVGAVAESTAAADAQSSTGIKPVAVAETAAATDAPASLWIGSRAVAESAAATDASAGALVRAGAVAETAAAADAQAAAVVHRPAVAETASITDAPSSLWISAPILVAESAAIADTTSGDIGTVAYSETVPETAAAADAPASLWIGSRPVAETAAAVDAPASTAIKPVATAETAAAADAPASLWIGSRAVAETAAAADAQAAVRVLAATVTESAAAVDATTGNLGAVTYDDTVAETAAIADAPASTAIKPVATAETASVADASSGLPVILKAITESAIVLDASSAAHIVVASVAETATASDANSATGPWHVSVAELMTATDATTYVYLPLQPPRESAIRARSINRAPIDLRQVDEPARRGTQRNDRRDANLG